MSKKTTAVLLGLVLAAVPIRAQTDMHPYSPGTHLERAELSQLRNLELMATLISSRSLPICMLTRRLLSNQVQESN